jgi:hypothetical protein
VLANKNKKRTKYIPWPKQQQLSFGPMFNPSALSKTAGAVSSSSSSSLPVALVPRHMALVHPPSTQQAVARQRGVGAPSSIVLVVQVSFASPLVCLSSPWVVVVGPWCSFPSSASVLGRFGQVSMTQHVYGARWGLIWWVSPSWGLLGLLSTCLTLNDTLTSCLDGEEGIGQPWAWVGGVALVSFVTTTMESKL